MRYFFHIGYNGCNYHGWQRHAPHLTVQEVLETNLSKLLKKPVTILGCGRTDAQVHASQYFFHLDTDKILSEEILFRLNKMPPEDIAIFDIIPVATDAHARYNATQRTYDYFIHTCKDPFLNRFSCYYQGKYLDTKKMQEALSLLPRYNDYYAFCKSPEKSRQRRGSSAKPGQEHTLCNLSSAQLFSAPNGDKLRIQVRSNRFIRGMIRAIVAQILKVGSGEISIDRFENYLIQKENDSNIEFAPPQGLYLSKVVYPFLDIAPRTDFAPFGRALDTKTWQLA